MCVPHFSATQAAGISHFLCDVQIKIAQPIKKYNFIFLIIKQNSKSSAHKKHDFSL